MRLNKLLGELHIDPIEKFISISEAVSKRLIESFNCVNVIPYAKEIFKLIENSLSNVVQFENTLIDGFNGGFSCECKLIEVCVHKFKWPRLKLEFERLFCTAVENNNWNIINTLQYILDAFEYDWEGLVDYYNELFR